MYNHPGCLEEIAGLTIGISNRNLEIDSNSSIKWLIRARLSEAHSFSRV